jgi:hypothetical protein
MTCDLQDLEAYNYTTSSTSSALQGPTLLKTLKKTYREGLGIRQSTPPVRGPPLLSDDTSRMGTRIKNSEEKPSLITRPSPPSPPPPPRYLETCNYAAPYVPFPDGQEDFVSGLIDEFAARPGEMRNYQHEWKHQRDKEVHFDLKKCFVGMSGVEP